MNFNCIDHDILYIKMENAVFSATVITWFRSYLLRSQCVKVGNSLSNVIGLSKGIAQGTVLGPILMLI